MSLAKLRTHAGVKKVGLRSRSVSIAQSLLKSGFQFEEVASVVEARRDYYGKQLRERKKPGRKCISDHVMSTAERVRKHRAKKKVKSARPYNER
jgi:hypothetical protein